MTSFGSQVAGMKTTESLWSRFFSKETVSDVQYLHVKELKESKQVLRSVARSISKHMNLHALITNLFFFLFFNKFFYFEVECVAFI